MSISTGFGRVGGVPSFVVPAIFVPNPSLLEPYVASRLIPLDKCRRRGVVVAAVAVVVGETFDVVAAPLLSPFLWS